MKKIAAFILAILVLCCSIIPCSDRGDSLKGHMTAKYEVTKQSQDNSDHNDACSPFCICSCCAGFSINHTLTSFSFVIERPTRSYSEAITAKTNSLSLPVWQPPQLTA